MSAPDCTLGEGLRQWLVRTTSVETADHFFPWVRRSLQDMGHDLDRPATEEALHTTKKVLRRADVTPARMQRAVREARRAEAEDLSMLEWARGVQERAYSEEVAEGAYQRAKSYLARMTTDSASRQNAPPTPEHIFAFLLAWEELGGTSGLAALRALERQATGVPSQN